jgi:hypothetical protein
MEGLQCGGVCGEGELAVSYREWASRVEGGQGGIMTADEIAAVDSAIGGDRSLWSRLGNLVQCSSGVSVNAGNVPTNAGNMPIATY